MKHGNNILLPYKHGNKTMKERSVKSLQSQGKDMLHTERLICNKLCWNTLEKGIWLAWEYWLCSRMHICSIIPFFCGNAVNWFNSPSLRQTIFRYKTGEYTSMLIYGTWKGERFIISQSLPNYGNALLFFRDHHENLLAHHYCIWHKIVVH